MRPVLGLGITHVHRFSFNEKGAGGASLRVESERDTFVTLQPALEVGREVEWSDDTLVRPYLRAGVTHFVAGDKRNITATLKGAPDGVAPFTIDTKSDRTYTDLSFGMDVVQRNGTNLRLGYTGQYSNNTSSHAASVKMTFRF